MGPLFKLCNHLLLKHQELGHFKHLTCLYVLELDVSEKKTSMQLF